MKLIPIIAMVLIATLEGIALIKGIDGAVFGFVIAALAGLEGYEIRVWKDKTKGGR